MKKIYLWAVGICVVGLVGAAGFSLFLSFQEGRVEVSDIFSRSAEAEKMGIQEIIVMESIDWFWLWEQKYPQNMKELCESPYFPFRCNDFKSPWTGKNILEGTPGDPGTFQISRLDGGNGVTVEYSFYPDADGEKQNRKIDIRDLASSSGAQLCRDLVEGWNEQEKTAATVAKTVQSLANSASLYRRYRNKPKTFDELLQRVPILKFLRNEFTGGYATVSDTPSEGNFFY